MLTSLLEHAKRSVPLWCVPRELVLRQPPAWIVRSNAARKVSPPRPKHEIVHVSAGSVCKRWHQYACCGPAKTVRDPPRRRLSSAGQIQPPRAGHISKLDVGRTAVVVGSEIDDIAHVNIIVDDRERLHSVRKAVRHFDNHGVDCRSKIERRNAYRIEAATRNCSTLPGQRGEGPSRIMATIENGLQPHAKLPSATPSR